MNIVILDYAPLLFSGVATAYALHKALAGVNLQLLHRLGFVLAVGFGLLSLAIAVMQVEALHAQDSQQSQTLSADCMTDEECEQLDMAHFGVEAEE